MKDKKVEEYSEKFVLKNLKDFIYQMINTETKIFYALLLDKEPKDQTQIYREFRIFTDNSWSDNSSKHFEDYSNKRYGKVFIKKKFKNKKKNYNLTALGIEYLKPLCLFLLESDELNKIFGRETSIYQILGVPSSNSSSIKISQPNVRRETLEFLAQDGAITVTKLQKIGNLTDNKGLLDNFKGLKLVNYDTLSLGEAETKDYVFRVWNDETNLNPQDAETLSCGKRFPEYVAEIMRDTGKPLTHNDVFKIIKENPIYSGQADCGINTRISLSFQSLERQGMIMKYGKFSAMKKSEISVTDKGIEVAQFLYKIDEIINNDKARNYWKKKLDGFSIRDEKYINIAKEKLMNYLKICPKSRRDSAENNKNKIFRLIEQNSGIRPNKIAELMNLRSTDKYLKQLRDENRAYKVREGKTSKYYTITTLSSLKNNMD